MASTSALAWKVRFAKEIYGCARLERVVSNLPPDWHNSGRCSGVLRADVINQDQLLAAPICEIAD